LIRGTRRDADFDGFSFFQMLISSPWRGPAGAFVIKPRGDGLLADMKD
jgi:hypothetical protein